MNLGVLRQPPQIICCTYDPDMLTHVHLISDLLCDKLYHNDSFTGDLLLYVRP